jgi:pyruvate/2-oxoglutarate dehydrogenase complex dihydrolipoamide dehydrogenase (E3) component
MGTAFCAHETGGGYCWVDATGGGDAGIEYLAVSETVHLVSDNEQSVVEPEPTFLKVIVDTLSWRLLGCLVVGDHASTLANSAAIAIESGLSVKRLREIPTTQPSVLEALWHPYHGFCGTDKQRDG